MSGPRARAAIALGAVAVAVLSIAGCGGSGKGGDEGGDERAPAVAAVCEVIEVPVDALMAPDDFTFAGLVDAERWSLDERAAVGGLRLMRSGNDTGRFEPLLDHLSDRHRELTEDGPPAGDPSDAVEQLAADLDELVADGGCGGG
jgi:hypothetical protein